MWIVWKGFDRKTLPQVIVEWNYDGTVLEELKTSIFYRSVHLLSDFIAKPARSPGCWGIG